MLNDDALTIGFMVAGFVWTIWWNLDWRRYLKFYGIKGPTYPAWLQLLFRTFFALCSLGAAVELGRRLLLSARPILPPLPSRGCGLVRSNRVDGLGS